MAKERGYYTPRHDSAPRHGYHARPDPALERSDVTTRGILLVNLGSPDSTRVPDVRRYLGEFLMDRHVIDSPWPIRRLIVSGFILPFRPRRTAEAYRSIWTAEGSPLLVHSRALAEALARKVEAPVELAMRYGRPDIDSAVSRLLATGVEEILLIPLYPHHADSTRRTTIERVRQRLGGEHARLRVLPPFYGDSDYLDVLTRLVRTHLPGDCQRLLFSFHGLPERHLRKADPTHSHCLARSDCCEVPSVAHQSCYRHQAFVTARAVAARLGLEASQWQVSFQSRLGRLPWLSPYTDQVLDSLPGQGITRLTVVCPAFVADNLETLEEIGLAGRARFLDAGGESFTLVPCLNDDDEWVDVLAKWCRAPMPESTVDAAH